MKELFRVIVYSGQNIQCYNGEEISNPWIQILKKDKKEFNISYPPHTIRYNTGRNEVNVNVSFDDEFRVDSISLSCENMYEGGTRESLKVVRNEKHQYFKYVKKPFIEYSHFSGG